MLNFGCNYQLFLHPSYIIAIFLSLFLKLV